MNQIFLDTNIILRFILADVPRQFQESEKIFQSIENKKSKGIISILVINEILWILENYYEKKRADFIPLLQKLISHKNIEIFEIKKTDLAQILDSYLKYNMDLTDHYLYFISKKEKCKLKTFDKKLANHHS